MTAINIVTAICLVLFTAEVIYVCINIFRRNRSQRISFIRGFKKGKCVAIFISAIPLICLGYVYDGMEIFESVLTAISHAIGLIVIKFGLDDIQGLIDANLFYRITVYYCCVLVTFNALLFTLSLIQQKVWHWIRHIASKCTKKDKLYIFGCNENSKAIYKSDKARFKCIADDISNEECSSLYIDNINHISCKSFDSIINEFFDKFTKKNNDKKKDRIKSYTFIINTENDENNLGIAKLFNKRLGELSDAKKDDLFGKLNIYIFGDPKFKTIYDGVVSASCGCMHYKDKYQMMAMDFIDKYPFASFMDERFIDYQTSLIKPHVEINVCMIGFGKPNQQIFLTSVANNQFITSEKGHIALKPVNYHIFDIIKAENNKNLTHSYYRFKNECETMNDKKYLPKPDKPAKEEYYHIDINDPEFYNTIREIVSSKEKSVNFVIVSFDDDLGNIDMAQKLVEKRKEWEVENLSIFVRVRKDFGKYSVFQEKNVFLIGNDEQSVYNIDEITNDKIFRMAQMRNEIYDLESRVKKDKNFVIDENTIRENSRQSLLKWYKKRSRLERYSSLYCCLSLRSKLNLMGLDYCEENENALPALSEDKYMEIYAGSDLPDTESYGLSVDGKKIIKYTLEFRESRRKSMAILEHFRWNSYMISQGIVPATKDQILNETTVDENGEPVHTDGKNYALRRHGNITTFDGLVEFRKMLAERDNGDEASYDVIKYDYQILDDAYWLLTKNGYKIVKREK